MDAQVQLFKQEWENIKQKPETQEQKTSEGTKHRKEELEELRQIDLDRETTTGELIDKLKALTYPPHKNAYFKSNGEKYFLNLEITRED